MRIHIPYGHFFQSADIPEHFPVDVIEAPETPAAPDPLQAVHTALDHPLGDFCWEQFSKARSVAIAINDKTRPVPHVHLLPPLLQRLMSLGIPASAITFHVAVGTHPPMRPDEFPSILPAEVLTRYRVVSHDSEDDDLLLHLGETARGTPVWVNRFYAQADLKIVIGNIEPHQFAGFSGGVKSAAIGLAGLKTINRNHALMTHPDSRLGEFGSNPARQDIDEIGRMIGIQLAVNAVLNQSREIVRVLAGEPGAVLQAGIPLSRQLCQVGVSSRYRLVISSPGGHPKDINVYQSQKGLAHAALITRPSGTVILAAACPEGSGSPHYETWMSGKISHAQVIESFRLEGFRIGPHKGYQISRDALQVNLMFCTDMDHSLARALLLNPVRDLQTAINLALEDLQLGDRVAILPHAASTIPHGI